MARRLRLKATDAEDLTVISSCLQDSLIPVSDMTFQRSESCFVMVANRFRWEEAQKRSARTARYERVHCGVRFDHVAAVRCRDLDRNQEDRSVSLLALEAGDGYIDLIFSDRGVIRLEVDRILCHLDDIDKPWPTRRKPNHSSGSAD